MSATLSELVNHAMWFAQRFFTVLGSNLLPNANMISYMLASFAYNLNEPVYDSK